MKRLKNLTRKQVGKLAENLASAYANKDVAIGLIGELGAGKTTFTKAFAQTLGIKNVKSPTFVVGSTYPLKRGRLLHHFDFYRLHDAKQLHPLGITEILSANNRIVLIEWVDKFPEVMKQCDLVIKIEVSDKNTRNVTIR